jgi:hypothetical protein
MRQTQWSNDYQYFFFDLITTCTAIAAPAEAKSIALHPRSTSTILKID